LESDQAAASKVRGEEKKAFLAGRADYEESIEALGKAISVVK